jgi:5-methylcytosine-specific restriction endonuclease McrA
MGRQSREARNELRIRFGGKCQVCGYSHCLAALQFHHLDPAEKEGWRNAPVREVKHHPERFQLVCSNCHHELHEAGRGGCAQPRDVDTNVLLPII